jgi:Fe-S cluster biogenesis protein NfuA
VKLFSAIKSALGIQKPLVLQDGEATVRFGELARLWLSQLPAGQGVHLSLFRSDLGYLVRAEEGEQQGPPPAAIAPLPVTMSDDDFDLLKGLTLDRRDGRWLVGLDLDVRAQETPNPNGRTYLVDRILAVERPLFFHGDGPHPDLPARLLRVPGVRSVLLRDNTATVERDPAAPWEGLDPEIDAALRAHFLACGHEVWPEDASGVKDDAFEAEIWAVLTERVLPGIHRDGGSLELVGVADGVVRVAMVGSCRTCPSSTMTLRLGIEKTLRDAFPDRIQRVEAV